MELISDDVFVVILKWPTCRRTTMFNCYNFLSDYVFDLLFVDVLVLTQLIAIDIMSKLMVWWFHWYIFPYIFLVHMNHQMHMLVRRSNFLHRHASVECLLLK